MRARTRQRVLRAIAELGYRPSRVARQLRTGRAQMIGLLVPSVANPFWGSFARVLESEALRWGLQVLLCNSERDPERERTYVDELWASGVRGVVIGTSLPSLAHLRPALRDGLRVVAFDRERQADDGPGLISVSVDNYVGALLATRHLVGLGHTRIGFVSGEIATVSRRRRLAGWRAALREAGVRPSPSLVWTGEGSGFGDTQAAELGQQGMTALLRLRRAPTAVVTINDMYAIGACAAAREHGLSVPGDVSVAGFDDIFLAPLYNPPLTTVDQPLEEMAEVVIDALRHPGEDRPPVVVTPRLVIRASTAPPKTRDTQRTGRR